MKCCPESISKSEILEILPLYFGNKKHFCAVYESFSATFMKNAPYTMHHTPYTMHHTPCTIHFAPYTIHQLSKTFSMFCIEFSSHQISDTNIACSGISLNAAVIYTTTSDGRYRLVLWNDAATDCLDRFNLATKTSQNNFRKTIKLWCLNKDLMWRSTSLYSMFCFFPCGFCETKCQWMKCELNYPQFLRTENFRFFL